MTAGQQEVRMFQRIEVKPAYRVVCETIEAQIVAGTLRPGTLLPTETQLADSFGLTRHTVREGLRQLEKSGLVGRAAGRRLAVRLPDHAELAPRATQILRMQGVTFHELWEASMLLEPESARGAAAHVAPPDLAALDANLAAMEDAVRAGRSIIALDVEFHALLAAIAANKALMLAREPVSQLFFPALKQLFDHPRTRDSGPRRLIEAHRQIVAALRARDGVMAEAWMRRHIQDFRRGYDVCGLDTDQPLPASFG
ncbi:MAG: FadR family transcriptional regulator [Rhodobacter sp.]|nr:FadR family transcriptional regulator [Rhodobacter sp.]